MQREQAKRCERGVACIHAKSRSPQEKTPAGMAVGMEGHLPWWPSLAPACHPILGSSLWGCSPHTSPGAPPRHSWDGLASSGQREGHQGRGEAAGPENTGSPAPGSLWAHPKPLVSDALLSSCPETLWPPKGQQRPSLC